jgi:hypothetical protein
MSYIYKGEPEQRVFSALPPGDYNYTVAECGQPYEKDNGNWVLAVKLAIQPSGVPVFSNPWTGTDKNGEERDGIGEFLLSCARAPKPGTEPDWKRVVGARGRCRLKNEIAQMGALAGKEVSKVAFFHRPKEVGPSAEQPPRQSFTESEIKESQAAIAKTLAKDPDLDVEPDDIPF